MATWIEPYLASLHAPKKQDPQSPLELEKTPMGIKGPEDTHNGKNRLAMNKGEAVIPLQVFLLGLAYANHSV